MWEIWIENHTKTKIPTLRNTEKYKSSNILNSQHNLIPTTLQHLQTQQLRSFFRMNNYVGVTANTVQ